MRILLIIVLVLTTVLFSCSQIEEKKNEIEVESENHSHKEIEAIELNNGAKWKVDSEMIIYIREMESSINHFAEIKQTELNDFIELGDGLLKNIDLLTSNCTMQGKAHDELHKWLLPYIETVEKLNKSQNSEEAFRTFDELIASYKTFNTYFE